MIPIDISKKIGLGAVFTLLKLVCNLFLSESLSDSERKSVSAVSTQESLTIIIIENNKVFFFSQRVFPDFFSLILALLIPKPQVKDAETENACYSDLFVGKDFFMLYLREETLAGYPLFHR